jgi:glycosyltransferase involved in cell wall biosynthesis
MPVYNGGRFFESALTSALAQTYPNTEIIVVNDGSTDGGETRAIAQRYASAVQKIRYIEQPNCGVAGALNTGIEAMSGDIFCWLSHDDLFEPRKTEVQVEYHRRVGRPDAVLFSDYSVIDQDGRTISEYRANRERLLRAPMMALLTGSINGCTLYIPRHVLDSGGKFEEKYRYVQDYRMWNRLLKHFEFFHIPQPLVRYRSHPGQDSLKPESIIEGDDLWIEMMDHRTEVERVQMEGSTQKFFEFMASHLDGSSYRRAYGHARDRSLKALSDTLVSVIVPVASSSPACCATIRSALTQNHVNVEVLAVGTRQAIDGLEQIGSRVRSVCLPTAAFEYSAALNVGMERSQGSYIAFARPGISFGPDWILGRLRPMQSRGILAAYSGGPGARDLMPEDMLIRDALTIENIILHRSLVDAGFIFSSAALAYGESAALASLARMQPIVNVGGD